MEELKKYIDENPEIKSERVPFLQLAQKLDKGGVKGTGPHEVILVGCEEATNRDYKTKQEIEGFHLFFEENGEKKRYFIPKLGKTGKIHYLVERFADIEEGTKLVLEYKKKEGSYEGYIDIRGIEEEADEDIPILEDDVSPEMGG